MIRFAQRPLFVALTAALAFATLAPAAHAIQLYLREGGLVTAYSPDRKPGKAFSSSESGIQR